MIAGWQSCRQKVCNPFSSFVVLLIFLTLVANLCCHYHYRYHCLTIVIIVLVTFSASLFSSTDPLSVAIIKMRRNTWRNEILMKYDFVYVPVCASKKYIFNCETSIWNVQNLGARSFSRKGIQANRGDTSAWTDTPEQKKAKGRPNLFFSNREFVYCYGWYYLTEVKPYIYIFWLKTTSLSARGYCIGASRRSLPAGCRRRWSCRWHSFSSC